MLTVVLAVVGGTVVVPLVAVVPEGAVLVGVEASGKLEVALLLLFVLFMLDLT
jgi:hypothetical protein